jgi:multicomponent Na+:H+ antiporter subunit G
MRAVASYVLMGTGTVFLLLAAAGLLRMPDFYTRMQVATKATTLGIACSVLAAGVWFLDWGVLIRAALIIAFIVLTTPVGAHVLGRMAYLTGVSLWEKSVADDLARDVKRKKAA